MDATKFLVANMLRSITKKLEIELLYGQMGYGVVASAAANVITISTAEWAPGIWSGAEGMPIEIRDAAGTTSRGEAVITLVDLDARTVTVNAIPAGVVATDVIWHKGAYGNEFAGVHKIISNTGTLFNISAATYSLWKGNSYSAGSADLSLAKLERAVALAVAKGLDEDIEFMINPKTWANLLANEAALRKYDQSYSPQAMENGAKSIKFYGQNGAMSLTPSIYVKEGYAYGICKKNFMRVGSQEVSFKRPGGNEDFFKELENNAGVELRVFTDQALFCDAPGRQILVTAIVNS